jgi:hypothetical protein
MLFVADGCQSKVPYGNAPREVADVHTVTLGCLRSQGDCRKNR